MFISESKCLAVLRVLLHFAREMPSKLQRYLCIYHVH